MAIEKVETESDQDIFRSAMADEPEAVEQSEPKADATGRLHGQDGKYVEKAPQADAAPIQQQAEPTVEPPQITPDKDEAQVPSWRLRELREQREAAETRAREFENRYQQRDREFADMQRQLHELRQPKQDPPDIYTAPDQFVQHQVDPIVQPLVQQLNRMQAKLHKMEGERVFGSEIDAFKTEIVELQRTNRHEFNSLSASMEASDSPFETAKQWFQQRKLMKETGGDITTYRTKLETDLLKDPTFLAKALDAARAQAGQPGNPPKVQIPPSLNKATGSAGNGSESAGDMSDASLWAESRPTGRRR